MSLDDADRQLLLDVLNKLGELQTAFEEYRPLLDRYKAASEAGSFLKARKAMRNG